MFKFRIITFAILISLLAGLSGCLKNSGPWTHGLAFDRVLIIVLENTDYSAASADPYLSSLAAQGASFSNFRGNFHPSYANYLAMVGGKYFGTVFDKQKDIDAPTIADLLEARGLTWKNYAQDYPGNCFLDASQGNYARKHVPFLSFKNIQTSPARCANVVSADQFPIDVSEGKVPNYAFYSPNLINDAHDTDLATASSWLKGFLEPLLNDEKFMERTLIEITFDESKTYLNNHIYTVFLGPMVKPGFIETAKTSHYSVLRTFEENFGIGNLGNEDKEASPIQTIWK